MKKKFFYSLIVTLSITSIIFGSFYYNHKIKETAEAAKSELGIQETTASSSVSKEEIKGNEIKLTNNLPDSIASKIEAKQNSNKPVEFVILGSKQNALENGTWTTIFKKNLDEKYGEGAFHLNVFATDEISKNVQENKLYEELLTNNPDLVLIEPFLLNDNGNYVIEDTLIFTKRIIKDFEQLKSKPVILLQPTNPIYQPQYYAEQVEMLKEFAAENEYIYIDHWKGWPSVDSEEIKQYIESNRSNAKGNELWAKYFSELFIAE